MQETIDPPVQQSLPGERQWLRSALLADQDGILTATRLHLARLARARGIEPDAIEDVIQETLLEAWSHLDRLHSPAGFRPWINEICRNVCRRAVRRQAVDLLRQVRLLQPTSATEYREGTVETDLLAVDAPDPLEALSRQDLQLLLDRALSVLPPAARQIVEMRYLLELPHAEMAARLHLSNSALDVRLHRARRRLRQILHGPLRREAEALGLALDEALAEGWQPTRLWCPLCGCQRLEGCFLVPEAEDGPNLHVRCPDCSRRYNQDTVHSMGLVCLSGLHSFRPAWKRTMQGLTDRFVQALQHGQHSCLYCGQPAFVGVEGNDTGATLPPGSGNREARPYSFWISIHCIHCGNRLDTCGNLPSIDQLVYWSHPISQQFVLQHPRCMSEPARHVEYDGAPALLFQMADLGSSDRLSVLAHRQTLCVLSIS
jgi:RNA polymerase sigma factor (sigma-70 family)